MTKKVQELTDNAEISNPAATLHGAVTHSTVLRAALTRGLAELERQYLGKPGATP